MALQAVIEFAKEQLKKGTGTTEKDLRECYARMKGWSVLHEGWITKQGKLRKTWKKRYFALLAPGHIVYLESQQHLQSLKNIRFNDADRTAQAASNACLGTIPLAHIDVDVRKIGDFDEQKNVFSIRCGDLRTFYLSCERPEEVEEWVQQIKDVPNFEAKAKQAAEEKKRAENVAKYTPLLATCKDGFTGGTIKFGNDEWSYVSGGDGDEKAATLSCVAGKYQTCEFTWNGSTTSGAVTMTGREDFGWGEWDGKLLRWMCKFPCSHKQDGQLWGYTSTDFAEWKANDVSVENKFPSAFVLADNVLRAKNNADPGLIPNDATVTGSVPPHVVMLCCLMASSIYQLRQYEGAWEAYQKRVEEEQREAYRQREQERANEERAIKNARDRVAKRLKSKCSHSGSTARFCNDCMDGYCERCNPDLHGRCEICGKCMIDTLYV